MPPGERKSGMPDSVEIPAPVKTTAGLHVGSRAPRAAAAPAASAEFPLTRPGSVMGTVKYDLAIRCKRAEPWGHKTRFRRAPMVYDPALSAHEHREHAEHASHANDPFISQVSITVAALAVLAAAAGSLESVEAGAAITSSSPSVLEQE